MKILFLTLMDFDSLEKSNIYTDLLREFVKNKHDVYVISPVERKKQERTHVIQNDDVTILKLKIGNMQKINVIEKGISTLLVEKQFIDGIKHYFSNVQFDFVLYSTPPVTLGKAIEYVKKRDGAKTYLMLKDIFPQNAIDMGMLSKKGLKGIIYKYFRSKEKMLYKISDYIGCMSQANIAYVLRHNPEINSKKVQLCPNSIRVLDKSVSLEDRERIRAKYGIPQGKKVFIYGGNLGKPQGIDFLIRCLKSQKENKDAYFVLVGAGTEYGKLETYIEQDKPINVTLLRWLEKEDYDMLVAACDVGMIFLDFRFTIPNFPSRLLTYMQAKIPVLAVTDDTTDIGQVIVEGGFGWWCRSDNVDEFNKVIKLATGSQLDSMKDREYQYLKENYAVEKCYSLIQSKLN